MFPTVSKISEQTFFENRKGQCLELLHMDLDKENPVKQVGRKSGLLETSIPRTPFAEVNRQRTYGKEQACTGGKSRSGLSEPSGKPCQIQTFDALLKKRNNAVHHPQLTPVKTKSRATLKNPGLRKRDLYGMSTVGGQSVVASSKNVDLSCSLPASPFVRLLQSEKIIQSPVTSHSCPEILSSNLSLPEVPPSKLESLANLCLLQQDKIAMAVSDSDIDLSIECEDATPYSIQNSCCEVDSEAEGVDSSSNYEDVGTFTEGEDTSHAAVCRMSASSYSIEGISSETGSPARDGNRAANYSCGKSKMSLTNLEEEAEPQVHAISIVQDILEGLLGAVAQVTSTLSQDQTNHTEAKISKQNSNNSANSLSTVQPHTCMAEYTKFVETLTQEDSPRFYSETSSLTDVTPISPNIRSINSSTSVDHMVVLDCLGSFLSDPDNNYSPVQRQLVFQDLSRETANASLNESARSSSSQLDLREKRLGNSAWMETDFSDQFPEDDLLDISDSGKQIEYFALPSSSLLRRHTTKVKPILRSVACSPILYYNNEKSLLPGACFEPITNRQAYNLKSPSIKVIMNEATTSPSVHSSAYVESFADENAHSETSDTNSGPVFVTTKTNDAALSPFCVTFRDESVLTDTTETSNAGTMTQVLTSDIALSPVAVSVKEINTMTMDTTTADVGLTTEEVQCLDHSALAKAEVDNKMTMTDRTGCRSSFTTMTPLKMLAKHGHRFTTDSIRKQHPRTLANQLETLTISNSHLENELHSAQQECKQLQEMLKETNKSSPEGQRETAAAEKHLETELKETEVKCHELEQLSLEQQNHITALEQELSSLRSESEVTAHGQEKSFAELQLDNAREMLQEQEELLSELQGLFADLEITAHKQKKVNSTYQKSLVKLLTVARENYSLKKKALSIKACPSSAELNLQQVEMNSLQQLNTSLTEEVNSLKQTMTISNNNLIELEKLYSVSSSDLLTATGKIVELNTELFGARKAMQEALLEKETMSRQANELENKLIILQKDYTSLTQKQQREKSDHGHLRVLCQKMKKDYEDQLEKMMLGVENLQRTLDNRELDIDHLEKDLYECRNIIVEQRYKIDGLESDLREAKHMVTRKKEEEDEIEFFKESNAFLEAERSVYVQSLRDLEEKLKTTTLNLTQQKQAASEADKDVEVLQEERDSLRTKLADLSNQLLSTKQQMQLVQENHDQMKSVAVASANDLLQHMQFMLTGLKKKVGLQEVPELYDVKRQSQTPLNPSRSFKSKRHCRKSFVSEILGAVTSPELRQGFMSTSEKHRDSSLERVKTGSYTDHLTDSVAKQHLKDVKFSTSDIQRRDQKFSHLALSTSESNGGKCSKNDFTMQAAEPIFNHSLNSSSNQPILSSLNSWMPRTSFSCSNVFTLVHTPSKLPGEAPCSLSHPPASEPLSSAIAQIRTIPKTKCLSEQSLLPPLPVARRHDKIEDVDEENGVLDCVASMKNVFSGIVRLTSIVDRATQLSLQDLREENDMLRERTEILEERVERNSAQLEINRQEMVSKDAAICRLQQQSREMTEHMMTLTDHRFKVKQLSEEIKRLESQLEKESREKDILSLELESLLQRLEKSASSPDKSTVQARCMRDIIALKKKNVQLNLRLEEQRDHYEELGSKAARRLAEKKLGRVLHIGMRVLDENWKKAEDEVYKLDELVENIKQIAVGQSSPLSPESSLRHILQLIEGEARSSPHK